MIIVQLFWISKSCAVWADTASNSSPSEPSAHSFTAPDHSNNEFSGSVDERKERNTETYFARLALRIDQLLPQFQSRASVRNSGIEWTTQGQKKALVASVLNRKIRGRSEHQRTWSSHSNYLPNSPPFLLLGLLPSRPPSFPHFLDANTWQRTIVVCFLRIQIHRACRRWEMMRRGRGAWNRSMISWARSLSS